VAGPRRGRRDQQFRTGKHEEKAIASISVLMFHCYYLYFLLCCIFSSIRHVYTEFCTGGVLISLPMDGSVVQGISCECFEFLHVEDHQSCIGRLLSLFDDQSHV
jgi:hypothetical protein